MILCWRDNVAFDWLVWRSRCGWGHQARI